MDALAKPAYLTHEEHAPSQPKLLTATKVSAVLCRNRRRVCMAQRAFFAADTSTGSAR